jgi:hypothetical protein
LTLRLFQADDPANILWESRMPGFRAWFELPHVSRDLTPDLLSKGELAPGLSDDEELPVFRVLGGVRIRLAYQPYDHRAEPTVTWTNAVPDGVPDSHAALSEGEFYESFAHEAETMASNEGSETQWSGEEIHWQARKWRLDPDVFWGRIEVDYGDGADNPEPREFAIKRRLLEPRIEGEGGPMQGADVAMLEEMLWQLGFSADGNLGITNGSRPGIRALRLPPEERNILKEGVADVDSVGMMLARFNYVSHSPLGLQASRDYQRFVEIERNGRTYSTLQDLRKHWLQYQEAYNEWQASNPLLFDELGQEVRQSVEDAFDGNLTYPDGQSFPSVSETYTGERHQDMLRYHDFDRFDIVRAISSKRILWHSVGWDHPVSNYSRRLG